MKPSPSIPYVSYCTTSETYILSAESTISDNTSRNHYFTLPIFSSLLFYSSPQIIECVFVQGPWEINAMEVQTIVHVIHTSVSLYAVSYWVTLGWTLSKRQNCIRVMFRNLRMPLMLLTISLNADDESVYQTNSNPDTRSLLKSHFVTCTVHWFHADIFSGFTQTFIAARSF